MVEHGIIDNSAFIADRVRVTDTLAEAVGAADYIQASVLEQVDVKAVVSQDIGVAMRPEAVVGSSSSAIPASTFTVDAPNRHRFLVAHPVNPPHLVPVVELVPAPWMDAAILPWLRGAMEGSDRFRPRSNWRSTVSC
jgi:L-gulonate 3-dehydrogenase